MSVLGTIISRVFGHEAAPAPATPAAAPAAPAATPTPAPPAPAAANMDAAKAVLRQLAAKNPEKLDWENSIVDLMKLVHMNPTLEARRELAHELGYTGDTSDTATMNVWLHQQVMNKLAENGGGVAENLLHPASA
jgi:3-oxoacyl-ACP reductase-like protein